MTTSLLGYGLGPNGFNRLTFSECQELIYARYDELRRAAQIDEPIARGPGSLLEMHVDAAAYNASVLWETLEKVYYSGFIATAENAALDLAVTNARAKRLQPRYARAMLWVYGAEGATMRKGDLVANSASGYKYALDTDVKVTATACTECLLIPEVANSTEYQIWINGSLRTYKSSSGGNTLQSIITGIAAAINVPWLTISSNQQGIKLQFLQSSATFSVEASPNIKITGLASPVHITGTIIANERAEAGSITQVIGIKPTGIVGVVNQFAGEAGRTIERDDQLRIRAQSTTSGRGAGAAEAIQAALDGSDIGIEYAAVYENDGDTEDGFGRPPHSIQCVVQGGYDADVARLILAVKPAGTPTYGNRMVGVMDSQGTAKAIQFSRPEPLYVWVRCVITAMPQTDEILAPTGPMDVQQAISDAGNDFGIGRDVAQQRLVAAAVGIRGVERVKLLMCATVSPAQVPTADMYRDADIIIGHWQYSVFDPSRISVS